MKLKDLIDIQKQCEFCKAIGFIYYLKMVLKIRDTRNPFSLASKKFVLLIKKYKGRLFGQYVTYEEEKVVQQTVKFF